MHWVSWHLKESGCACSFCYPANLACFVGVRNVQWLVVGVVIWKRPHHKYKYVVECSNSRDASQRISKVEETCCLSLNFRFELHTSFKRWRPPPSFQIPSTSFSRSNSQVTTMEELEQDLNGENNTLHQIWCWTFDLIKYWFQFLAHI